MNKLPFTRSIFGCPAATALLSADCGLRLGRDVHGKSRDGVCRLLLRSGARRNSQNHYED